MAGTSAATAQARRRARVPAVSVVGGVLRTGAVARVARLRGRGLWRPGVVARPSSLAVAGPRGGRGHVRRPAALGVAVARASVGSRPICASPRVFAARGGGPHSASGCGRTGRGVTDPPRMARVASPRCSRVSGEVGVDRASGGGGLGGCALRAGGPEPDDGRGLGLRAPAHVSGWLRRRPPAAHALAA